MPLSHRKNIYVFLHIFTYCLLKFYNYITMYTDMVWSDCMSYEKKKKFIVNITFYTLIAAIVFLAVKYLLGWIMPFVVAFAVSAVITPFAKRVSGYFKVGRKFAACFAAFLFYAFGTGLVVLCGFGLYAALKNLFYSLPQLYADSIEPALASLSGFVQNTLAAFDPAVSSSFEQFAADFFSNAGSMISDVSVNALSWLSAYITKIPYFIAAVFIAVIATFFIASDYDGIKAFIARQIPEKWHIFLGDIREYSLYTLGKYIKSYTLIMTITFCELSLGLWLLGVKNFAVIALVTAVFDIIPVCGSGGVLLPWAVFSLVQGRYAFGTGMLILYAIITVIRQIIEPKIVGDQVGLPPVVTLMAMFLGVRFMGVIVLFLFPMILVILKNLNDSGRIKLFR